MPWEQEIWVIIVSEYTLPEVQRAIKHLISPEISFPQIKEWISACMEEHGERCGLHRDQDHSNLRVINCERRVIINAPADCDYVALSYVWGSQSTGEDFMSMQNLPQTIEHSIIVTIALGYKYLWVDRYCINQRNQQHRDNQILQMSSIYMNAQLTIIAAAGSDPTHGLPGVGSYLRERQVGYHEEGDSLCLSALDLYPYTPNGYLEDALHSKWAKRAWTYQEGMFSRRRLIFTERQVIFSCNKETCFESQATNNRQSQPCLYFPWVNVSEIGEQDLRMSHVKDCLSQYCQRDLSHESDALNGIVSSLNMLSRDGEYHIWGIPFRLLTAIATSKGRSCSSTTSPTTREHFSQLQTFEICLSWYGSSSQGRRLGFPSWSPLGWTSVAITWADDGMYTGTLSLCTPAGSSTLFEYLQCSKKDPNAMPQLLELTLETMVVEVCDINPTRDFYDIPLEGISFVLGEGLEYRALVTWDHNAPGRDDSSTELRCALKAAIMNDSDGSLALLVLESHDDHYERVGFCNLEKKFIECSHSSYDLEYVCKTGEGSNSGYAGQKAEKAELETHFGDLKRYEWWKYLPFEEERIVLG
ncbi:tol protein [Stagonosporopsis vannaccii]|nr:tol protein [Stagonosporopsis vannaccii]